MGLSTLKHTQQYMTTFELNYRNFEFLTQRHQISTIFNFTVEEVFKTLETAYVDMSTAHSMIELIVKQDFSNTLHHQNGPNQRQHIHKNTSHQYQPKSYQRPRTS